MCVCVWDRADPTFLCPSAGAPRAWLGEQVWLGRPMLDHLLSIGGAHLGLGVTDHPVHNHHVHNHALAVAPVHHSSDFLAVSDLHRASHGAGADHALGTVPASHVSSSFAHDHANHAHGAGSHASHKLDVAMSNGATDGAHDDKDHPTAFAGFAKAAGQTKELTVLGGKCRPCRMKHTLLKGQKWPKEVKGALADMEPGKEDHESCNKCLNFLCPSCTKWAIKDKEVNGG